MNNLFFLHSHYIPRTLQAETKIIGTVIVPEFNTRLTTAYYGENKEFNSLEESFEYISALYNSTRLYFSLENLNVLDDHKKIPEYKKVGLIMLQLYHNNNRYFNFKNGLTDDGCNLLKTMEKNRMVLDLSHLNDYWVENIASIYGGKIVVSHCACDDVYIYKDARSNALSAKIIEVLGKRGVLFGIAFVNDIIASTSHAQDEDDNILMMDLLMQVKKFKEIIGINYVALGPDFFDIDYFSRIFGVSLNIPRALFHDTGYEWIKKHLIDDGFSENEINWLFYKNACEFLK
jgi:microsomal dipeptidase-like Zn-dependent dipeptidase